MKRPNHRETTTRTQAGFTLIELIIVLVIIAALAAILIPTLGYLKDQSDSAVTANTAQEILNNLELYKASTGRYPERLDTLTDSTGAYYTGVYNQDGAFPFGTIETGLSYTLTKGAGLQQVAVHDSAATDPNNSSVATDIDDTTAFCVIDPENVATIPGFPPGVPSPYQAVADEIVLTAFPNQEDATAPQIPENHTLIALGVGSLNGAVGSTMSKAPLCPEKATFDPELYDRYIAVFDVDARGGPTTQGSVQLVMVLDSQFKTVAKNLQYYENSKIGDDQGIVPAEPEDP